MAETDLVDPLGAALTSLVARSGVRYQNLCHEACIFITSLARIVTYKGANWAMTILPHLLDRLEESAIKVSGALRHLTESSPNKKRPLAE